MIEEGECKILGMVWYTGKECKDVDEDEMENESEKIELRQPLDDSYRYFRCSQIK